ncbi:MAG TPA: hypothetical protein VEL05_13260 [Candidatus Acidoferrum sp.]|nr:hypothetical protein [Candidatus Acidoferrum sp.]
MASRERKRTERRKRKERGVERRAEIAERYEERNRAAREELEPLEEGERPAIVTVAALVSAALATLSIAGFALWDVLRDDPRPNAVGAISFVILIGVMAYGLWHTRYWAVLGFQAALVLVLLGAVLGTISALTVGLLIGNLVIVAIAGTLFYFMVRAMARIQMPERRPPTG